MQISKFSVLTEAAFEKENILFNGVIISELRKTEKPGFKKIAEQKASIGEVEFPGWFMNDRYNPGFYRGELRYEVKEFSFGFIHENWRILLSGSLGIDRLARLLSKYYEYLESMETGNLKKGLGIWGDDIRYNARRGEILKAIGVSFDEPYYKVLAEELGEERLNIYKQAITPSPKKGSA